MQLLDSWPCIVCTLNQALNDHSEGGNRWNYNPHSEDNHRNPWLDPYIWTDKNSHLQTNWDHNRDAYWKSSLPFQGSTLLTAWHPLPTSERSNYLNFKMPWNTFSHSRLWQMIFPSRHWHCKHISCSLPTKLPLITVTFWKLQSEKDGYKSFWMYESNSSAISFLTKKVYWGPRYKILPPLYNLKIGVE